MDGHTLEHSNTRTLDGGRRQVKSYYLKGITVPIPMEQGPVVIRNGKTVEYETERVYSAETRDSRVKRLVIGKVDPLNPGRMNPNEKYFQLFPENEVPEEIRDGFLRECEMKRDIAEAKRNPEELARRIVSGLEKLSMEGLKNRMEHAEGRQGEQSYAERRILFSMFEQVYYYMEELAMKFPNDVVDRYKVESVNELLEKFRGCLETENMGRHLELIEVPREEEGKTVGMSYSDVMILLKWYKSMSG